MIDQWYSSICTRNLWKSVRINKNNTQYLCINCVEIYRIKKGKKGDFRSIYLTRRMWIHMKLNLLYSITAKKFFFRYYLSSAGCLYLSMYVDMYVCVFFIVATPFNLQLWNFGITFLMWLSKTVFFSICWKIVFLQSYCPFLYFLKISL